MTDSKHDNIFSVVASYVMYDFVEVRLICYMGRKGVCDNNVRVLSKYLVRSYTAQ